MKKHAPTLTEERKRENAYHESAHAVTLWMFGYGHEIQYIDMRGKLGIHAWVQSRNIRIIGASGPPSYLQLLAKQRVIHLLAGYGACNKLNGQSTTEWLDYQLDWEEYLCEGKGHDLTRAIATAKDVYGDNGNAMRMVRRMAVWTDEALDHPRIWAAVESLGEQLLGIKTRMSGTRVRKIMVDAWGEGGFLPYLEMGRKWKRRFTLKPENTT